MKPTRYISIPAAAEACGVSATTAPGEWMTLAECAADVRVDVELVRQWCIAWERDNSTGLPFSHYGAKPEETAKRKNRRVRREDWTKFKAARSRRQAVETRSVNREWERAPLEIPTRRRAGAASGPGR